MTLDTKKSIFNIFNIMLFNGGGSKESILWIEMKKEYLPEGATSPGKEAFQACAKVLASAHKKGLRGKKISSNSDLSTALIEKLHEIVANWKFPEFAVWKGGNVRNYY